MRDERTTQPKASRRLTVGIAPKEIAGQQSFAKILARRSAVGGRRSA